ncbi:porphobilinogen synthase [Egicoccus sp. AB-alg2]|uniref:porphobilinogen synthase n=1 Tax=Egicoccus sp. AB-alg2 TaxID=3242693 RepID=UPI00359DB0C8
MPFPESRLRRLRRTPALRRAFAETRIDPAQLVLPVFVKDGVQGAQPIGSMPGVAQHDVASAVDLARQAVDVGVGGIILFGIPATKDAQGSGGWDPQGPVPRAARALREALGDDLVLWADVCQCEYTDHGHCGPLDARGQVVNDAAVEAYVRDALAYADAGVDVVAPSGMMDGQVAAIRAGLDAKGFEEVALVAYAAKYASAFYGPFREAAESTMQGGDRASHQMDPANRREAMLELAADADEGADVLMVKPALAYLDVIADAREVFDLPIAAYQVSGEYAMLHAAAERGWIDGPRAMREAVTSIRRAGADLVLTYAAIELATGAGA